MNIKRITLIWLMIFLFCTRAEAQQRFSVINDNSINLISRNITYLEDNKGLSVDEVTGRNDFIPNKNPILNLGLSDAYFWLKVPIVNRSTASHIVINVEQPALSVIEFYQPDSIGRQRLCGRSGTNFPFSQRETADPGFTFTVNVKPGDSTVCYLKIKGNTPLIIPVTAGRRRLMMEYQGNTESVFYIYLGLMACMFLYNAFLMLSIRDDKSYIWYVIHTLLVTLTQASFLGYTFQYLWPDHPWLARQSIFLLTCLVSIAGIIFLQTFLQTARYVPKLNRIFYLFFASYGIIISLSLAGMGTLSYKILQPTQMLVALFILYLSVLLVRRGFKQARFYLLSWSLFMIAIIIFALKDFNLIPYNIFTSTLMLSGSAVQVILLSFALADKINILQATAIRMTRENLKIIEEKNAELELKVSERTGALRSSNAELNETLNELKQAQTQLVESEKMASLGQLTAGIAHEINNPINFVTANVSPLKRDIHLLLDAIKVIETIGDDEQLSAEEKRKKIAAYKEEADLDYLKTELDHLLKGINEGAARTAEIVRGLRIFSRIDEDDIKVADINEGLESTIIIINNLLNNIEVIKAYNPVPLVECYPGKLNQVFLNIITNSIHAMQSKFGDKPGGVLTLETSCDDNNVFISIADNGTGMTEEIKKRIFEPFFTTKEVGEGTGLGMSIAYNTLKKHNGQIQVNTEPGKGSRFILQLPIRQQRQND